MSWILDSLTVLSEQWSDILRLLAFFAAGGLLTFGLLRQMLGEHLDTLETFLLALAGWPLWWVLCALLGFFIARPLPWGPGWAAFLFSLSGLLIISGWKKIPAPFGRFSWLVPAFALTFLLSLLTRLAFLVNLLVPSYFDGALHFQISQHLLNHFGQWPWQAASPPVNGYYHIGFHLLVVSAAFVTNLPVEQVILLLGQLTLAVLPFPVLFATKHKTGSTLAAFFAFVLAGWGWNMPAHALNWGKYPALAGLLALQFVLMVALTAHPNRSRRVNLALLALVLAGAAVAALMHTRSLVVIFIFFFGYFAAMVWERLPSKLQWATLAVVLAALAGLVVYIESRSILNLAFDPYLRAGLWITLLVVALTPFAVRRYKRLAMTCLLALLLIWVCLLVPMPGQPVQTPLDRPFVQMILYLPLALLGGLGLAGLRAEPFRAWQTALATVAVFSAILISIEREYPFSASECCILFKTDDAIAFEWVQANLPQEAHFLIAGNTLNVFDIQTPAEVRSADGGAWIAPFTGRRVSLDHLGLDFSAQETLNSLCQRKITHIYIGGAPERFNTTSLQARPEWYMQQLTLPGAQIFKIVGCP